MPKTLKLTLIAVATLAFSAGALAAEYTMRLSHQYPPTHQVAKALERIAHRFYDALLRVGQRSVHVKENCIPAHQPTNSSRQRR